MSTLFSNLIGRAAGTGPQLRPIHPLYRGDGGLAAPEVVEDAVADSPIATAVSEASVARPAHRPPAALPTPVDRDTGPSAPAEPPRAADRPTSRSAAADPPPGVTRKVREVHAAAPPAPPVRFDVVSVVPGPSKGVDSPPTDSALNPVRAAPPAITPPLPTVRKAASPTDAGVSPPATARPAATDPPTRRDSGPPPPAPEAVAWDATVPAGPRAAAVSAAVAALAAPPAASEGRQERHVTVSIGRLEVKVVPPLTGAKPPAAPPPPGLADYLRRRGGGDR